MTTIILPLIVSLLSGTVGVLATLWWERRMSLRHEKQQVFKTLMANRCHIVSEENVRALNLIDVVFYSDSKVRNCFAAFVEASGKVPFLASNLITKYLKLVESIAAVLNYNEIDWERINECVYYPTALTERQAEEDLLRKASLKNQLAMVGQQSLGEQSLKK